MAARAAAKPKTTTKRTAAPGTKAKPGPKPKASKAPPKRTAKPKRPAKRPGPGRPTTYSLAASEKVCQHIANGGTIGGLDKLDDPSMPASRRAWEWLQAHDDFRSRYTAAAELRITRWPEQVLEIADEPEVSAEAIARAKLRIDTRLRLMHKLARPVGDGGEGSATALSGMSWEEKVAHAADLFRTLGILVEDDDG